jgi:hypothetical protein
LLHTCQTVQTMMPCWLLVHLLESAFPSSMFWMGDWSTWRHEFLALLCNTEFAIGGTFHETEAANCTSTTSADSTTSLL